MFCLHSSFEFLLKTVLSEFNLTFSNFFVYIYHSQCLIIKMFWNWITLRIRCEIFKYKVRRKFNWLLNVLFSITFSFWRHPKEQWNYWKLWYFVLQYIHWMKKEVRKKVQNGALTCLTFISTWLMCAICHQIIEKRQTSKRSTLIYDQDEL